MSMYMCHRDIGIKAIEMLMQKKGKFDYVILETTGLADPGRFGLYIMFTVQYTCVLLYIHYYEFRYNSTPKHSYILILSLIGYSV